MQKCGLFLILCGLSISNAFACEDWVTHLGKNQAFQGVITYEPMPTRQDPVVSTFTFRPKNCTVVGRYEFIEPGNQHRKGQFSLAQAKANEKLNVFWHDDYGFGQLKLQFNDNLSSFTGIWFDTEATRPEGEWTGHEIAK